MEPSTALQGLPKPHGNKINRKLLSHTKDKSNAPPTLAELHYLYVESDTMLDFERTRLLCHIAAHSVEAISRFIDPDRIPEIDRAFLFGESRMHAVQPNAELNSDGPVLTPLRAPRSGDFVAELQDQRSAGEVGHANRGQNQSGDSEAGVQANEGRVQPPQQNGNRPASRMTPVRQLLSQLDNNQATQSDDPPHRTSDPSTQQPLPLSRGRRFLGWGYRSIESAPPRSVSTTDRSQSLGPSPAHSSRVPSTQLGLPSVGSSQTLQQPPGPSAPVASALSDRTVNPTASNLQSLPQHPTGSSCTPGTPHAPHNHHPASSSQVSKGSPASVSASTAGDQHGIQLPPIHSERQYRPSTASSSASTIGNQHAIQLPPIRSLLAQPSEMQIHAAIDKQANPRLPTNTPSGPLPGMPILSPVSPPKHRPYTNPVRIAPTPSSSLEVPQQTPTRLVSAPPRRISPPTTSTQQDQQSPISQLLAPPGYAVLRTASNSRSSTYSLARYPRSGASLNRPRPLVFNIQTSHLPEYLHILLSTARDRLLMDPGFYTTYGLSSLLAQQNVWQSIGAADRSSAADFDRFCTRDLPLLISPNAGGHDAVVIGRFVAWFIQKWISNDDQEESFRQSNFLQDLLVVLRDGGVLARLLGKQERERRQAEGEDEQVEKEEEVEGE